MWRMAAHATAVLLALLAEASCIALRTLVMSAGVCVTAAGCSAACGERESACIGVANGAAVVDLKVLKIAAAAEVAAAVQHVANGSACNGCAAGSAC
jgi:hypothetical protein